MESFYIGCEMTHSIDSENNVAESILNFLKFSTNGETSDITGQGCLLFYGQKAELTALT